MADGPYDASRPFVARYCASVAPPTYTSGVLWSPATQIGPVPVKVLAFTTTNALSSSVAAMHAASRLDGFVGSYSSFWRTTLRPRIPPHALIWSVNTWNMSFTLPTGSEYPSGSYFSSCERICTTLIGSLVAGAPVFVQKVSFGANGFADASPCAALCAPAPLGTATTSAAAATHTAIRTWTPRRFTPETLERGDAHASSRGSEVR